MSSKLITCIACLLGAGALAAPETDAADTIRDMIIRSAPASGIHPDTINTWCTLCGGVPCLLEGNGANANAGLVCKNHNRRKCRRWGNHENGLWSSAWCPDFVPGDAPAPLPPTPEQPRTTDAPTPAPTREEMRNQMCPYLPECDCVAQPTSGARDYVCKSGRQWRGKRKCEQARDGWRSVWCGDYPSLFVNALLSPGRCAEKPDDTWPDLPPKTEPLTTTTCSGSLLNPFGGCNTLMHACTGDFNCYGDDTCACYECTGGPNPPHCGL